MSTVKLIAGAQSAWASLMTTELNSLANLNSILGSTSVDNGTNNDIGIEFSFGGGGSITPTGSPFFSIGMYPQNGDGSTYGDGRFGSAAAAIFPLNYWKGYCGLPAAAATQTGTFSLPGTSVFGMRLPRGIWKPVFYNGSGVTLTATNNILYYRTFNLSVV